MCGHCALGRQRAPARRKNQPDPGFARTSGFVLNVEIRSNLAGEAPYRASGSREMSGGLASAPRFRSSAAVVSDLM